MTAFKCLSVSQPFADLIVKGKKTIELRSWNTSYRGEFLVHAPIKIRTSDCKRLGIDQASLPVGAIIGKATIHDVKLYQTRKEWQADQKYHFADCDFSGSRYGFLLKGAKSFVIPIPCKGKLGFFDVQLDSTKVKDADITSEIFDEEYRTQWINHH
ncbi:MAG TPA: ASCH domain-containing protein [Candidatus Nitrosotenuis sp.]